MTFPTNFKIVLCQEAMPGGSMLCFIGQRHDCIDTHFLKGGKKTVNFFGGQKLEVCYHASYLYINRVCRFVRFS